jgi:2-methylcitrate dehydratase PrpD
MTRRRLVQLALMGPYASMVHAEDGVTLRMAEFVVRTRYDDLPPELIELGKKSILDGAGLALVGSVAKSGALVRQYIESLGALRGSSTVMGSALKASPRFAAFANGVGIHADDYDDTQLAVAPDRVYGLLTHPTAPCLSAALAVAEAKGSSGRDLMLAYHVGAEVECKIAEAINPRHYQEGFHSTGTCGPFAAAAAASKLYGVDVPVCARALSIAGSQSAGLRENFGTMTKPFHAGHAAESGIVAADLARLGWTASDRILEAPNGFFRAAGGGFDPSAIRLAKPWTFVSPGVSIKPFPSGSLTHPGMSVMLRLIREHNIAADQVERVDVGTNRNMPTALIHHQPTDSLQAKFSMEFCMAALLLYHRAGLNEFTDEVVRRPEVQAIIRRVRFGVDAEAEKAGYNKMTTLVSVHMKDGRTFSERADFAKGSPADPMTFEEVAAKFQDCARFAKWPANKANSIMRSVQRLEDLDDVRKLTALFAA